MYSVPRSHVTEPFDLIWRGIFDFCGEEIGLSGMNSDEWLKLTLRFPNFVITTVSTAPNLPIFFNTGIPKNFDKDESLLTILAMLILKLGVHRAVIPKYSPMHEGLNCANFCADKYQKFPMV